MEISITEITSVFRGDHASDISISHEYVKGETVEDCISRCLRSDKEKDHIELRFVVRAST